MSKVQKIALKNYQTACRREDAAMKKSDGWKQVEAETVRHEAFQRFANRFTVYILE